MSYREKDRVILAAKYIKLPRVNRKLSNRYIRLFSIVKKIGTAVYQLYLPL